MLASVFHDPRLVRMAAFLESIGIEMRAGRVEVPTQFPGSLISYGTLIVEEARLVAPGDALHEAAHIAVTPPGRRRLDFGILTSATGGEELATIPWSWAALLKLEIEPEDIFHAGSYKDGSSSVVIENARQGNYIGFPLLQHWGMAHDEKNARRHGVTPFPHMVKWLRE